MHNQEQDALLKHYLLDKPSGHTADEDNTNTNHNLLAPFVPCASARINPLLHAARLQHNDVLYDLGCGDGRLLHAAAAQFGCTCVGIDIDAHCIREAQARAAHQGCDERCTFVRRDMLALGAAALDGLPPPTCLLVFLTGHGLVRLESQLRQWHLEMGVRILTCVESLDAAIDYEAGVDELFEPTIARRGWQVWRGLEHHGIYVVPPRGVSVDEWAAGHAPPPPPPTPAEADASAPCTLPNLLDEAEVRLVVALGREMMAEQLEVAPEGLDPFGDGDSCAAAEDYFHGGAEHPHHVAHLHRGGRAQRDMPRLLDKIVNRVRRADAERWRLLVGRAVGIRSIEYHEYAGGGSVADPGHRDQGSLLTLSVLLTQPDECVSGGEILFASTADGAVSERWPLRRRGDGVLFVSEKRHNVSAVASGGRRASLVLELWCGAPTSYNRHR